VYRLWRQASGNHVVLKYDRVKEAGPTWAENGFKIEALYTVEMPEQLAKDLSKTEEPAHITVPVRWIVNDEEITGEGYIKVSSTFDSELGKYIPMAEFDAYLFKSPGTYTVKAYIPETVEADIKFCVYAYSPEDDYYTVLVGCYPTYEEAEEVAKGQDTIIEPESENVTHSGEIEVDLGTVTIGGRKTPPPRKREPIWRPGKLLRLIFG